MIRFGSAAASRQDATASAVAATRGALAQLEGGAPKLAIVFSSGPVGDLPPVFAAVRHELGEVPVIGGLASGAVFGPEGLFREGVSVVLLAGQLEVVVRTVRLESESRLEVVPVAREVAAASDLAASRGLPEFNCLLFAPGTGSSGDGDQLVAAVRKGVGQRASLAGAMTGDNQTFGPTAIFAGDHVAPDVLVLAGVFTATPFGVAARHGWRPSGRTRRVTRSEGSWLVSLDDKPAFDVWVADARAAGGHVPDGKTQAATAYLADHFALDVRGGDREEAVVRIPLAVRDDGAVRLSGSVGEAAHTRIVRGTRSGLLAAGKQAARATAKAVDEAVAGGLVLTCGSRLATLGTDFPREAEDVARELSAPVGGACVFGEIARGGRDVEAFHNATVLVVAVPRGT